MSIYSEYIDRITNGDINARHGGSLTTSFEKVAKSVRSLDNKLSAFESNINPLYEQYNGGSISDDNRLLMNLFTRSSDDPFGYGMNCKILTEAYDHTESKYVKHTYDMGSLLHYSYEVIYDEPPFHYWYHDEYSYYVDFTNNLSVEVTPHINIYHPDGTLNVSLYKYIYGNSSDIRICQISLKSYQSMPKVQFHFYRQVDSGGGFRLDIRPSDEISYYAYDSIIDN